MHTMETVFWLLCYQNPLSELSQINSEYKTLSISHDKQQIASQKKYFTCITQDLHGFLWLCGIFWWSSIFYVSQLVKTVWPIYAPVTITSLIQIKIITISLIQWFVTMSNIAMTWYTHWILLFCCFCLIILFWVDCFTVLSWQLGYGEIRTHEGRHKVAAILWTTC